MEPKIPSRKLHPSTTLADGGRRRSKRVLLSIPIDVTGTATNGVEFKENTRTLVVNAHGALIALTAQVKAGQVLTVVNRATNQVSQCRVIYLGNAQADKVQMGIEFVKPTPYFWQLDFPPDDWVVPES